MNDKQQLQALGAEHTRRFDADLDWLARNVHEWPDIVPGRAFAAAFVSDGTFRWLEYPPVDWGGCYNKHQWLARRAELQNKPDWKDAPDWAEWLAQDGDKGLWWYYSDMPTKTHGADLWRGEVSNKFARLSRKGEVLGDWRDTLERRPNGTQQPAIKEEECRSIGAEEAEAVAQHLLALLKRNPRWLDSGTLAEIVELADAELVKRDDAVCGGQAFLDAHWFECGEQPPVGVRVLKKDKGERDWDEVTITGAGNEHVILSYPDGSEVAGEWDEWDFRPLLTERQRVVSEMVDVMMALPVSELKTGSEHAMDMALAIYDKFLSKQGGDNADTTAPL
ncbi:hypothetical protein SAMN05880558_12414 [Aeromonas sp. RU39B]|uniref:hypothetical protein n=1 Tax=Aeromonas sp. RU39B TaxID=1907416 RepID=UPI00095442CC|nr:hypothetical protein [Aeromonas sp. RU39B]SIR65694.1 hypothetical protein SAMN05880558_12414 [Aeromonas sp. RU39B]